MPPTDLFEKFLNWLKTTPQFLLAISIICACLLFIKGNSITALGLEEFITENRAYIGMAFLISTAFLVSYPVKSLADWVKAWCGDYSRYLHGKKFLKMLSPQQKKILKTFIDKNSRSAMLDHADGNVTELNNNGIIYLPRMYLLMGTFTDYNLKPWAFEYLKKHPELLV